MSYDIRKNAWPYGPKPPFHQPKIPKPLNIQKPKGRNVITSNK